MTDQPYLWKANSGGKYCVLESLQNVPDAYEIAAGKPRLTGFPKNAQYHMNREFKKQVALADNLWGPGGHRVISGKLKSFVETRKPVGVEFLPVSIIDHKGKVASADYFLLHPVRIVDCIDQKKSQIDWNAIDKDQISSCPELVFNLKAIPEDALVFRPRHMEYEVFVQRQLADDISAEGFTALLFMEPEEYGS
jgi:hypothetical protein